LQCARINNNDKSAKETSCLFFRISNQFFLNFTRQTAFGAEHARVYTKCILHSADSIPVSNIYVYDVGHRISKRGAPREDGA